jgi:hypothetical protein
VTTTRVDSTVQDVFAGDGKRASHTAQALKGVRGSSPGFIKVATTETLAKAVWDVFDFPLGDLIFSAWDDHEKVNEAKAATAGKRGERREVEILTHTIRSTHHPIIELEPMRKDVCELDLILELKLSGAIVSVAGGQVVGVSPGDAQASATLGYDGQTLLSTRPVKIRLRESIPPPPPPY